MEKPIKGFNLKFNKLIYIIIPVIAIIAVPVISLRILHIAKMVGEDGYSMMLDIIVIALLAIISAVTLSCIFLARYVIKPGKLVMQLGPFWQTVKIADIKLITNVRSVQKIVISFSSGEDLKQIGVSIDPAQFDSFIDLLMAQNKNITYNIDSDE